MGVVRQAVFQCAALIAAVSLGPIKTMNFADAAAGQLLDDSAKFDEDIA
jgi:hypothetical protein